MAPIQPARANVTITANAINPIPINANRRSGDRTSQVGRSPQELFAGFLTEQNIDDQRLTAMFGELLDEVTSEPAMTREA